ncbi:MAG: 1-acyl-sn-glycerol-3-phosphate acyltransferase [Candidatus Neomarinimicrobiota bacterium]
MYIPKLGDSIPKTNSVIKRAIGRFILWSYRWRIEGEVLNSKKFMVILAPHTSYWDFLTNMGTMLALGIHNRWFVADVFCWWPLGNFMRWLGGIPIDRNSPQDLVSFTIGKFTDHNELILALYPEGTTRKAEKWKTGFWHIARGADIPIQFLAVDYKNRVSVFGPVIRTSDDIEADMKKIQTYFKDVIPKASENFVGNYF